MVFSPRCKVLEGEVFLFISLAPTLSTVPATEWVLQVEEVLREGWHADRVWAEGGGWDLEGIWSMGSPPLLPWDLGLSGRCVVSMEGMTDLCVKETDAWLTVTRVTPRG